MAMTEHEGLQIYKDAGGNCYILYPITKAHLVEGLDELLDGKAADGHNHAAGDINSGVLPVARGGTGAATAEQARTNLGAAKAVSYTVTLPTASWSSSAPHSMTVTVTGILATDEPIIDCVLSGDTAASKLILEAWGCVSRITTAANSITAYCYDKKPAVNIPIKIKVVR